LDGDVWSSPTFPVILSTAEDVSASSTSSDTLSNGVVWIAINLCFQLTARIVFLETACVSVKTKSVGLERSSLLGNGKTVELDVLLSRVGVIDIHCPLSVALVGIGVPLLFGD
jgi:hypothetical protein